MIWIFIYNICQFTFHTQNDAKFLLAFAYNTLFASFTNFYLASGKFPQQSTIFISWALTNKNFTLLLDHSC